MPMPRQMPSTPTSPCSLGSWTACWTGMTTVCGLVLEVRKWCWSHAFIGWLMPVNFLPVFFSLFLWMQVTKHLGYITFIFSISARRGTFNPHRHACLNYSEKNPPEFVRYFRIAIENSCRCANILQLGAIV